MAKKGERLSLEERKAISERTKRQFLIYGHPRQGKRLNEEQRDRLSKAHIGLMLGENNPAWKGGISSERNIFKRDPRWRTVSQRVWKNYGGRCLLCGEQKKDKTQEYHIHHVIPFENTERRYDVNNLVLLCKDCHIGFVHSKKNTYNLLKTPESVQTILLMKVLDELRKNDSKK